MSIFNDAAAPLAAYLANIPVNDELHQGVLADLYDMVNTIRDEKVALLKGRLAHVKANKEKFKEPVKEILTVERQLRALEGVAIHG